MTVQPPSPPYLGPAKFHGGTQTLKPLKRIVIHGTVSPCVRGGARIIANYFRNTVTRPSSAHYVVDPGEVVQVVGDHQVAYHAPPNQDSIGVEHCDPVAGPVARWQDDNHVAMLNQSAELVARLCLAYNVPIRRVGSVGLRLGRRGITGHRAVSNAWKQTSHTDPGDGFPWKVYLDLVAKHAEAIKAPDAPPPPPAKPIPAKPPTKPLAKGPLGMTLVTSNIKNLPDLPREQVRHDTDLVRKLGGVLLWQEIAEQDDRDDLATSCPPGEWDHVGLDTEAPISFFRANWKVIRSGRVLLHTGKAAVSPTRWATWAEVVRTDQDTTKVPPVVVVNTHWVSGAFSHPGQPEEAWRVAMWNVAHTKVSELVAGFLAEGRTVLGGGDYNRTGVWPGFAPSHTWLVHGGFDHLWACEAPKGTRVTCESVGTLGLDQLFTDHPARWAHVNLLPPGVAK